MRLYLSDSYRLIVTNVIENAKLLRGLEGLDKNPDSGLLFKIIIVCTMVIKYRLHMFIVIIRISGQTNQARYKTYIEMLYTITPVYDNQGFDV